MIGLLMNGKGYESGCGLFYSTIPAIFLEGLRKTMKNFSQNSWPLGQYLKLGPPK
jgi:hypothetical protein